MTGARRLAGAAAVGALIGCAQASAPPMDPAKRRPDGVSIDPAPALPEVAPAADADATVTTLETPLGTDAALALLDAYVRAIVGEDLPALAALHAADASIVLSPPGQPPRAHPNLTGMWERRFARLDYGALKGTVVVRAADARVRRVPPEERAALVVPTDDDAAASPFRGAELVVRAPVLSSRASGQALLGTELSLYLRREGRSYRVAALVEDFSPP